MPHNWEHLAPGAIGIAEHLRVGEDGTDLREIRSGVVNVNIPSIPANSGGKGKFALPGVRPGDVVLLAPPEILIDTDLIYIGAAATDVDEVSAYVHNPTASAIDWGLTIATTVEGVEDVTPEEQTISGTPTGETFTLSFGGETTTPLAAAATAAAVGTALDLIVTPGGVTTVGGPLPGVITITFDGTPADVAQLTSNDPGALWRYLLFGVLHPASVGPE